MKAMALEFTFDAWNRSQIDLSADAPVLEEGRVRPGTV